MGEQLEQLIRDRYGVVLRKELYGLGISPRAVARQVEAGTWTTSGRSVLVHSSAPGDRLLTRSLVAALRNPDAVLTGASAALLRPHPAWSRAALDAVPAMIIAHERRVGPWQTVRHPRAVYDEVAGLRITDTHTTLVDLLRFLPWPEAAAVAGAANRHGLGSPELLADAVRRLHKYPGAAQLRVLVRAMERGAESGPEIDLHLALHRAGIGGWVANPEMEVAGRQFRPDIAFPSARVGLEYDGFAEHSGLEAFHHDRERINHLQFHEDWQIYHVTSRTLYDRPVLEEFHELLRAKLDQRRRG